MSIATSTRLIGRVPKLDLSGCVLYAPLWRPDMGGNTSFVSAGEQGIPRYTCTVTGATYGYQGRTLDGVDDRIVTSNSDTTLDITGAITYGCWVNPTNGGDTYGRFISKTNADPYGTRVCKLGKVLDDETAVRWEADAGTALESDAGAMTVGAWNCVFGTSIPSGNRVIYVNGASVKSDANGSTRVSTAGGVLWIGSLFTDNQNILATLGEVFVYNRALTAPEIQQIFNSTRWRYGV